jgi:hypothetical protein
MIQIAVLLQVASDSTGPKDTYPRRWVVHQQTFVLIAGRWSYRLDHHWSCNDSEALNIGGPGGGRLRS